MIHKIISSVFTMLISASLVFSQDDKGYEINLQHANELEGEIIKGKGMNIFKGKVVFKYLDHTIMCDSAYKYSSEKTLETFGNVKVYRNDSLLISSDHLSIVFKTHHGKFNNNVKILGESRKTFRRKEYNFMTRLMK